MIRPKVVLVVGFGNLGAKLLSLRFAFPFLRFAFIEPEGEYFWKMRKAFEDIGTLRDLRYAKDKDLCSNLLAFRDALSQPANSSWRLRENQELKMLKLFDAHIHYGGDEIEGCPAGEFGASQARYKQLIRGLIEYDRSEVLLYLATRPELYIEKLKKYSFFANCVAIDKPLAKDEHSLREIRRFAQVNPDLTILPIDHYLFKLDFTEFMKQLEGRGGLNPREVQRLDVTICEEELDESRVYFIETGIIRDMMPHVAAMVSLLFRNYNVKRATVGNITPVVRYYQTPPDATSRSASREPGKKPVIVQAEIELSYWTSEGYLPVSVRIAKGEKNRKQRRKEIIITWHTGQRTVIDLSRKQKKAEKVEYADWAAALSYLMSDWPLLEEMRSHFTFDRACEITADVLAWQTQADLKVPRDKNEDVTRHLEEDKRPEPAVPLCNQRRAPETFLEYPATNSSPKQVFIFNFDGVVINTEDAHIQAWETWYKVIGHAGPTLMDEEWFEPGKPNREMVSKALASLYGKEEDQTTAAFAIQYGEKYCDLFHHILRGEKLKTLEKSLPRKGGPASPYHETVLRFLQLLRQFNQHLVLVTTNHPLLVQQTLDHLLRPEEGWPPLGFDRHYVGQRKGTDTYDEIIKDYRRKWGREVQFVVFDDYLKALENLQVCYEGDKTVRLIHMDTMKQVRRKRSGKQKGIEHFKDFQKLIEEFSFRFGVVQRSLRGRKQTV
jgi:hypothetical protein